MNQNAEVRLRRILIQADGGGESEGVQGTGEVRGGAAMPSPDVDSLGRLRDHFDIGPYCRTCRGKGYRLVKKET